MQELEHAVLVWLQSHASPWLDQRTVEATALGDGYVVTVIVVTAALLLWAFGARVYAACCIPCGGGAFIQPEPSDRTRMTRPAFVLAAVLGAIAACGVDLPAGAQELLPPAGAATRAPTACSVVRAASALPEQVRETSGLARGANGFWTHNDAGGEPVLYRIDDGGALAQTVRVAGATLEDWEDVEAAPCDDDTCLYVGDIGDNDAGRGYVTIYRVREPAAGVTEVRAEALHLTYPDGARDAESLFVLDGVAYVVTKGRRGEIALYRAPANAWQTGRAELERVRTLLPRPRTEAERVTAATATPDGRRVVVRSYATLYVYDAAHLVSAESVAPVAYDLAGLGQTQGESIVMDDDGTAWLTSEAEDGGAMPSWLQIRCPL